jgi:predicted ribosome quality control (RQC) complex YloA/Tae2 family protein
MDEGERIIRFHFSDGRELAAFFFGKGSGNILLLKGEEILDSYRKYSGEYDRLIGATHHDEHRDKEGLLATLRQSDDPPAKGLARAIPELGSRLAAEALYRSGLQGSSLRGASDEELTRLLNEVDTLYAACESSEIYYLYHLPDEVVFSLTELRGLASKAEKVETFTEPGHALHAYRSTARNVNRFADMRARMLKRLSTEKSRIERALAKRYNADEHRERARIWESEASMLLANLHLIERGTRQVHLTDWVGNEL